MPYRGGGGSTGITNGAGNNVVPKSDGTNLVASSLSDNGTVVSGTEPIRLADGVVGTPSYAFTSATNTGLYMAAGAMAVANGGVYGAGFYGTGFHIGNAHQLWLGNATTDTVVGLKYLASQVIKVTDGGAGGGWIQQAAARVRLSAPYTNATATFSNTGLSLSVISGRAYAFHLVLFLSNSTAADGVQIDFNGGGAAMTSFIAQSVLSSATGTTLAQANAASTALATVINATTVVATTQCSLIVDGAFVPSSTGTFIVRAAENTHSTGTLTISTGSYLWIEDMP